MKVRFESLFRKKYCEECGKPAKWKCYEAKDSVNYYCDKCVKEK